MTLCDRLMTTAGLGLSGKQYPDDQRPSMYRAQTSQSTIPRRERADRFAKG